MASSRPTLSVRFENNRSGTTGGRGRAHPANLEGRSRAQGLKRAFKRPKGVSMA